MIPERQPSDPGTRAPEVRRDSTERLHPAWEGLIALCRAMRYGQIERVKIQDGIPVLVETVTRKVRLT